MRVVSLACSNTEIVCALGRADLLVGVDDHSDFPPDVVASLPKVGPDLEIDIDAVAALEPDLVLATLTVPGHEKVVAGLEEAGLPYVAPEPTCMEDVYRDVREIAALLEVPERGETLVQEMRSELESRPTPSVDRADVTDAPDASDDSDAPDDADVLDDSNVPHDAAAPDNSDAPDGADAPDNSDAPDGADAPDDSDAPTILVQWWPKPTIAPGRLSWTTDVIRAAGGRNPIGDEPVKSRPISDEEVVEIAPDAIVISWCGVDPAKYRPDVIYGKDAWADVPAVRNGHVFCVPEAWMGRPGPRLVEGRRALAELVEEVRRARANESTTDRQRTAGARRGGR